MSSLWLILFKNGAMYPGPFYLKINTLSDHFLPCPDSDLGEAF